MKDKQRNDAIHDCDQVPTDSVFSRIKGELERLSSDCEAMQKSLSDLLRFVPETEIQREIVILQTIDRVEQTLRDLASVFATLDSSTEGKRIDLDALPQNVRMVSLRHRLFPDIENHSDVYQDAKGEVVWF